MGLSAMARCARCTRRAPQRDPRANLRISLKGLAPHRESAGPLFLSLLLWHVMEGVTLFDQVTPIASPQFGSPPLVLSPTQEGGEARFKRAREENGFDSDCMEFSGASAKKVMSTVGGNDDFNQLTTPMIIGDSGSDAFNLVPPAIPSTVSERIMVDKTSVSELQKRVAELEALQARLEREVCVKKHFFAITSVVRVFALFI